MDLRQFWTAARKGWWLVAIAAVLGVAGALGIISNTTPQYSSSVTFFVSTPTADGTSPLSADQFATRRITSYVGLLSSDVVARQIVNDPNIDLDASSVASTISGEADLNTVLLTATVTDSSAQRAYLIAQGLATKFGSVVNEVDPIGPGQVVLRVISGPTLNPDSISPRRTLTLAVGFVLGAALGLVIALLRQVLDSTVRQPQLLRELTDDAPVLGVIPFETSAKKAPLIVYKNSRSIRAEAFRHLRTSLQFLDVEAPVRVVVVTSSVSGEGKSTTATNLAISFADSGSKVLLIEADLRRPRVGDYLGMEPSVGLSNVLAGQVPVDDVLQPWGGSSLTVLVSGSIPPNPSELLGSSRMVQLLDTLKKQFEIIILDTPPLLPVTDAAVVVAHADGAVLVVRHGKATRAQITTAVRTLTAVDARLLGTVMNMTPKRGEDGYGSYGYGHYRDESAKRSRLEKTQPAVDSADMNEASTVYDGTSGSHPVSPSAGDDQDSHQGKQPEPLPPATGTVPTTFRLTAGQDGATPRPSTPRRALRMKPDASAD